jgi:hypothetical protein
MAVATVLTGWKPYAKAIVGGLIAFLGSLATALDSGGISASEWIYAVIAGLVALSVVFAVPNKTS